MTGDLTAAFDFGNPDFSWPANLPSTAGNVNASAWQCDNNPPPTVPTVQRMPSQEPGTKLARSIPSYVFDVSDTVWARNTGRRRRNSNAHDHSSQSPPPPPSSSSTTLALTMRHAGAAGASTTAAVFNVYDRGAGLLRGPRKYTVEGGKQLTDEWTSTSGAYELHLHGPNGFVRHFAGDGTSIGLSASIEYGRTDVTVGVAVAAAAAAAPAGGGCTFTVTDNAYGAGGPWSVVVAAGKTATQAVQVAHSGNWYDVTVASVASGGGGGCGKFERRFMGHVESGATTTSDPAMAKGTPGLAGAHPLEHPPMPERFTRLSRQGAWNRKAECAGRRAQLKDVCWMPPQ